MDKIDELTISVLNKRIQVLENKVELLIARYNYEMKINNPGLKYCDELIKEKDGQG